jgi:hypothetical protein
MIKPIPIKAGPNSFTTQLPAAIILLFTSLRAVASATLRKTTGSE